MQEPQEEKPQAIEKLPPITDNRWLPDAGEVTVYRLRLMSKEQIAAAGLQKYAEHLKHDTHR